MAITAALVKQLRERTGAGMMECKRILSETNGDIEAAIEELRKRGAAQADKKAGRIAAEGRITTLIQDNVAVTAEINSETDFSAKDANFIEFAQQVVQAVANHKPKNVTELADTPMNNGEKVEAARPALIAKIGENITVRRFHIMQAKEQDIIANYEHGSTISVLVKMSGADSVLARDIAMHIAASKPLCINAEQISSELLDKEREIYAAQAAESGKPENIMEKMVEGRVRKYVNEVTLLGQLFVKDPDTSIEKLLKKTNASVLEFMRFEVGEGIEKKEDDFVSEVMAQAGKTA